VLQALLRQGVHLVMVVVLLLILLLLCWPQAA